MKNSPPPLSYASRTRSARAPRRTFREWWRESRTPLGTVSAATAATVLMLIWIFPSSEVWGLAFVALVPWTVAIAAVDRAWIVHWVSSLLGWIFFLIALRWLMPVTGLGYAALGFYLAIYWPMAAWAIRTGLRVGISPAWTLPVVWVSTEFLRGWVMSGFPWLFLGHALYPFTTFIQIADFGGAYAVTFAVAMVNGALADVILQFMRRSGSPRRPVQCALAAILTIGVVVGTILYGRLRLNEADLIDGPRIAVVQEDFPLVSVPPYGEHPYVMLARYLALGARAAAEKPDLIAFPETAWSSTQNISFVELDKAAVDEMSGSTWPFGKTAHSLTSLFARGDYEALNKRLSDLERFLNRNTRDRLPDHKLPRLDPAGGPPTPVLVGSVSVEILPQNTYPRQKRFNSALVYGPDGTQSRQRYDKTHLVPFGEIVPFRNATLLGINFHWLYRALNSLSPFSSGGRIEYSLWPGDALTVFQLNAAGKSWRYGVPICYEDVMPYVIRNFVWKDGEKRVDFLINISNDGWFLHSNELPQHLGIAAFRAVENRIGFARSVNTGISGFVDPCGRIYSLVEKDGRTVGTGIVGYRVDHVKIDRRSTIYGQYGDWLAIACLILTSALWLGGIVTRWLMAIAARLRAWRRNGGANTDESDRAAPTGE
ncbi:MAG: apolipoprotein N-acyltransferase [Phycisphaerae bacterium]